jgi:hypothetical protein
LKTHGQLLRDVNFERGCSYCIEPRPDNDVQSFVELEAEEDSSGFSDPKLLNIIAQFGVSTRSPTLLRPLNLRGRRRQSED